MNANEVDKCIKRARSYLTASVSEEDPAKSHTLETAAQVEATLAIAEGLRGLLVNAAINRH